MARSATQRLDISVTDAATVQKAQRLASLLATGNADLFRNALEMFDWCVREVRAGRHIMATESDHVEGARELLMPLLESARHEHGPLVLHAAAFDRIVEILEQPPAQPTAALRTLMAEAYFAPSYAE